MAIAFWVVLAFLILHAIIIDYHRSIVFIVSWVITGLLLHFDLLFYITGC